MKIPRRYAELSFTWKLTLNVKELLDVRREDTEGDAIRIDQVIEFNGGREGRFGEMSARENNWGQLNWRLEYLKNYLEAKIERAMVSLNREAFAFTDFIDKAVAGAEELSEITESFLAELAEAAEKLAIDAIRADGEEQIREAKERFDRAKKIYMRQRFSVVKTVCDEIKLRHDYLRDEFEKSRRVGMFDQKEWEAIWLKRAPRKHAIPDEILRMFAQGKTAGQVASRIVGLELNYSESTVEKYKKPSAKKQTEEERRQREFMKIISREVYGVRPNESRLETDGKKNTTKNSRSGGKKK